MSDGNGAYAGLIGEGRWSQEFTPGHIEFRLWGSVHAGSGS